MNWQELATVAITGGAVAYIGLRVWRSMYASKRTGRSCGDCAAPLNSAKQIPLVTIAPKRMTNDEIPNDEGMTKHE